MYCCALYKGTLVYLTLLLYHHTPRCSLRTAVRSTKVHWCTSPCCCIVIHHAAPYALLCALRRCTGVPHLAAVSSYTTLLPMHCCALYKGTLVYLTLLLHRHTPRCSLRTAGDLLLHVPCVHPNGTVAERLRALALRCWALYQPHYGTPGTAHN